MAEKFEDVVNKLGKATKKPSQAKAPIVLAVQLVDDKGKVIKEDSGAAATEEKREALRREKKETSLLERIAKAVERGKIAGAGKGKGKDEEQEGWTFGKGLLANLIPVGMLAALPGVMALGLAGLGIGAIVAGGVFAAVKAVEDGMNAWAEVEKGKWGTVDKVSGFIGGFLGGEQEGGIWNALDKAWQGAAAGMLLGLPFGLPGILIGAIVGAAAGGILGWIGGQKIAEWVDKTVLAFRSILDLPELLSEEQKEEVDKENAALETSNTSILKKLETYNKVLVNDNSTLEQKIEAHNEIRRLERELQDNLDIIETNRRRVAESTLAERDKLLKENRTALQDAKDEYGAASRNLQAAKRRVRWTKQRYGLNSKEHNTALQELEDAKQEVKDRGAHRDALQADRAVMKQNRSDLRTELDKEHQTFIGNTRLFFKGEMDWQKNFMGGIKDVLNFIYSPGETGHPSATGSPAKLFGIPLEVPASITENWADFVNFVQGIPAWVYSPAADGGKAKLFGIELPRLPDVKNAINEKWTDFEEFIKGIVGWIYTPAREAIGATLGPGVYAASPMILFGIKVPSLPDFKNAVKTKWADFEKFIEGIVGWIYSPGEKAEGKSAAKPMILFGMKIPSLPSIEFPTMGEIKSDIEKLLPEWIKDPQAWARRNFAALEEWAENLLPELPELGDIIPDISFDFPNPLTQIGDALKAYKDSSEYADLSGPTGWVTRNVIDLLAGIFPTSAAEGLAGASHLGMANAIRSSLITTNAAGGPFQAGRPMLVGELGPELILPNMSGMVLSAQRTAAIQQQALNGMMFGQGGGGPTLFAPVSNVNTNQTNMTQTSTSFSHPSPILATVNAAA